MPTFYHGTTRSRLADIRRLGLLPHEGWGGQNTVGVFFATSSTEAMNWAKIAAILRYQEEEGGDVLAEPSKYKRLPRKYQDAVVLVVRIPDAALEHLRGDSEQAEDAGLDPAEVEDDWQLSAEEIGSVRYTGIVPPSWIGWPRRRS